MEIFSYPGTNKKNWKIDPPHYLLQDGGGARSFSRYASFGMAIVLSHVEFMWI